MNKALLRGIIKNIQYSHNIQDVEYYKADLITKPKDGIEYTIPVKFKKFCNKYKENDEIELVGNIRSYSRIEDGKNRVNIYVFTYQDELKDEDHLPDDQNNVFEISGRICKKSDLKVNSSGKCSIIFTIANNLFVADDHKLNSYLPCVAFGKVAKYLNNLEIGAKIRIEGYIRSREYKKRLDNNDYVIRIAHELVIKDCEEIDEV